MSILAVFNAQREDLHDLEQGHRRKVAEVEVSVRESVALVSQSHASPQR